MTKPEQSEVFRIKNPYYIQCKSFTFCVINDTFCIQQTDLLGTNYWIELNKFEQTLSEYYHNSILYFLYINLNSIEISKDFWHWLLVHNHVYSNVLSKVDLDIEKLIADYNKNKSAIENMLNKNRSLDNLKLLLFTLIRNPFIKYEAKDYFINLINSIMQEKLQESLEERTQKSS